MKLVAAFGALLHFLAVAGVARAQAVDPACEAAYVGGQRLYKLEHNLLSGREQFLVCAKACPDELRASCGRWLGEIERALPSIVVKAKDAAGLDVLDVSIDVDGKPVSGYIEGTPIELNPGEHTIRVARPSRTAVEETVLLHAGDKLRVVDVWMEPRTITVTRRPIPVAAFVLAGVSAASLATFGVFSIWTTVEYDATSGCSGHCAPSSRDSSFTTKTLVADTSLGIAAASLVGASVIYLIRPARTERAPSPALLAPWATPQGAGLAWVTTF